MRPIGLMGLFAALLLPAIVARAAASPPAPQVGDTYETTLIRDSVQKSSNGSSATTHDKDAITERVIGLSAEGLELQYDLPNATTAADRARQWQLPARVFKPFGAPAQLLNGPELEARVDAWLKSAGERRTACGHWIFTWNAFLIECDPESALKLIQAFDLNSSDLREGATYQDTEASGTVKLARQAGGQDGESFSAVMPINPDVFRRAHAESDVVAGEIMQKPISLDSALHKRGDEIITGTVSVTFETDHSGNARRRTKVTKLEITGPAGSSETRTITETLERRLISRPD